MWGYETLTDKNTRRRLGRKTKTLEIMTARTRKSGVWWVVAETASAFDVCACDMGWLLLVGSIKL